MEEGLKEGWGWKVVVAMTIVVVLTAGMDTQKGARGCATTTSRPANSAAARHSTHSTGSNATTAYYTSLSVSLSVSLSLFITFPYQYHYSHHIFFHSFFHLGTIFICTSISLHLFVSARHCISPSYFLFSRCSSTRPCHLHASSRHALIDFVDKYLKR